MRKSYEIENEPGQIVIRLDSEQVDRRSLAKWLDYLDLQAIRRASRLSEAQAAELADDIDRNVWDQIKDKYKIVQPC